MTKLDIDETVKKIITKIVYMDKVDTYSTELIDNIAKELYYPHGLTKYYKLKDRVLFITQLKEGDIYDVSYLKLDSFTKISSQDYLQTIRLTSYRVCSTGGLHRYLKKVYPDFSY